MENRLKLTKEERRARAKLKSWSISDLLKSFKKFRSTINKTGKTEVQSVKLTRHKPPQIIINSVTRGTKIWTQRVVFPSIFLAEEQSKKYSIPINLGSGNMLYLMQLKGSDPIRVFCSCPDYRHSFSHQNFRVKSLEGRRIPYTKVAGSNHPPRNPNNIQGVCKHLNNLMYRLQDTRGVGLVSPLAGIRTTSTVGYTGK